VIPSSSPILATAVVPWTSTYEFDEARFRRQIETIASGLTRHIYVFGTAGEGYAVTERQFDAVASAFWGAARECQVMPMLGVISLSLPTIIGRIERGRDLGFREFQLSLPSWGALNDAELDTFFAETCGRFPDCRFHHYNLLRTKRLLTSVEYRRLAAAHSNLVAVKCSTDDPAVISDLLSVSPRLRFYFTEFGYAIARRQTADVGLLISVATANYARAHEFVEGNDAVRASAVAELRLIGASLREISTGRFHIDGAFDKMLYRLTDPAFPLRLLPPYATATDADFERFRDSLPARWRQR
jgi:dihydrodipicolinate synthase/N-acetylneuraminate lyase